MQIKSRPAAIHELDRRGTNFLLKLDTGKGLVSIIRAMSYVSSLVLIRDVLEGDLGVAVGETLHIENHLLEVVIET